MKYIGSLLLTAILLFLFVANFSAVTSRFECVGKFSIADTSKPGTIYIKLEEYRWWVGLWSKSDASLYVEVPNSSVNYYHYLDEVEDMYQIFFDAKEKIKGNFSTLSKTLALSTSDGFFDGKCTGID